MKKYTKKPVTIEAQQIKDSDFTAPHPNIDHVVGVIYDPTSFIVLVRTTAGNMQAGIGDWIIRGVEGELYPCTDSVFKKTYEEVIA